MSVQRRRSAALAHSGHLGDPRAGGAALPPEQQFTITVALEITETDGTVIIRDRTTSSFLARGHWELVYDELGRPVWRFTVEVGPHEGEYFDFEEKQDALETLPDLLKSGIWDNGKTVTEAEIKELVDVIDTYWVDPPSGS